MKCLMSVVYSFIERTSDITLIKIKEYSNLFEDYTVYLDDFKVGMPPMLDIHIEQDQIEMGQKALWVFAILVQIGEHILNLDKIGRRIIINILWALFGITFVSHNTVEAMIVTAVKLIIAIVIYFATNTMKKVKPASPYHHGNTMKMKNLANGSRHSIEEEDLSDTDDGSLYNMHNQTNSSNELFNNTIRYSSSARNSFCPWNKIKHNTSTSLSSSKKTFSNPKFASKRPSFGKYRMSLSSDSDSDLDESISSLCIDNTNRHRRNNKTIFSLKKFTASPNFAVPMPVDRSRPLISPSKLGYSTSWVAGGYWGTEGEHFNLMGSRSSSQSSGFESHASSLNQRNLFSQPPSREGSVCSDFNRTSTLFDRFQNCNINYPNSFAPLSSPVFPQMQYNNHVFIPQHQQMNKNSLTNQPFPIESSVFKVPTSDSYSLSRLNGVH